jgi:hypothetical protein
MKRFIESLALAAAVAMTVFVTSHRASATPITYQLIKRPNFFQPAGFTLSGSITVAGLGTVSSATDILAWSFTMDDATNTRSETYSSTDQGSFIADAYGLVATADSLYSSRTDSRLRFYGQGFVGALEYRTNDPTSDLVRYGWGANGWGPLGCSTIVSAAAAGGAR